MRFQLNEHNYFLHFDRAEGRWYVFEPTLRGGARRTPVVNDDAEVGGSFRYVIAPDEEHETVVN